VGKVFGILLGQNIDQFGLFLQAQVTDPIVVLMLPPQTRQGIAADLFVLEADAEDEAQGRTPLVVDGSLPLAVVRFLVEPIDQLLPANRSSRPVPENRPHVIHLEIEVMRHIFVVLRA
jgi:hypothetical protein